MVNLPAKRQFGRLVTDPNSSRTAVLLAEEPTANTPELFLRFALVVQGVEWPLLPAFLLDDWGREQRRLSLLHWVYENGDHFPRAEIFGFWHKPGDGWVETQLFVRDLDLMSRWPVFAFSDPFAPPSQGVPVYGLGFESTAVDRVVEIEDRATLGKLYQRAAGRLFSVPAHIEPAEFWQQLPK